MRAQPMDGTIQDCFFAPIIQQRTNHGNIRIKGFNDRAIRHAFQTRNAATAQKVHQHSFNLIDVYKRQGLSIAKTLTEAQHGRIWVESEKGSGSIFSVLLPLMGEKLAEKSRRK